ncbi:hypothetical protein C8R45DRAFT_1216292 [Mycena sanguinolenta]|nr:hypothetical protein C8R45DRAFT_1216292 [Mycena sanguinolenta]
MTTLLRVCWILDLARLEDGVRVLHSFSGYHLNWQLIPRACTSISTRTATVYDALGPAGLTHSLNEPGTAELAVVLIYQLSFLSRPTPRARPPLVRLRPCRGDGPSRPSILFHACSPPFRSLPSAPGAPPLGIRLLGGTFSRPLSNHTTHFASIALSSPQIAVALLPLVSFTPLHASQKRLVALELSISLPLLRSPPARHSARFLCCIHFVSVTWTLIGPIAAALSPVCIRQSPFPPTVLPALASHAALCFIPARSSGRLLHHSPFTPLVFHVADNASRPRLHRPSAAGRAQHTYRFTFVLSLHLASSHLPPSIDPTTKGDWRNPWQREICWVTEATHSSCCRFDPARNKSPF